MPEREKRVDLIALEQHFPQSLEPCYDSVAGDGFEVRVPRGDYLRPLVVQVFPDTNIARLTTGLTDFTLRHARVQPSEIPDVLELRGASDEEWALVEIQRSGGFILTSLPRRPEANERPAADGLSEGSIKEEDEVADPPQPEETPAQDEQTTSPEHERVNLTGRVGIEPRFRTTKNDKLVCSFPLAVHNEDGSTKWHDVVAFGERAIKLQDSLQKGQEVEIVGYVHTKTVAGKDGKPKEKHEVWAAVVRKPSPKP